jgi:hypothetical protein
VGEKTCEDGASIEGDDVSPTELSLFSEKEQTILVATETARIAKMSEDELGDLLMLVRRARNKYSTLHRRQATASIDAAHKRAAAASSNTRTLRKAEIFEDALARVSASLASAARASRDELKKERLAAARGQKATMSAKASTKGPAKGSAKTSGQPKGMARTTRTGSGSGGKGHVTDRRAGAARATNARSQAKRDRPRG